jgi:hypothetical protein
VSPGERLVRRGDGRRGGQQDGLVLLAEGARFPDGGGPAGIVAAPTRQQAGWAGDHQASDDGGTLVIGSGLLSRRQHPPGCPLPLLAPNPPPVRSTLETV